MIRPSARHLAAICIGSMMLFATALAPDADARRTAPVDKTAGSTPAAKQAFLDAMGALQRADTAAATTALNARPAEQFGPVARTLRACILQRIDSPADESSPDSTDFAERVVAAYRNNWRSGLVAPSRRDALASALLQQLRALLGAPANAADGFDAVEALLQARLARQGLHMLGGMTPPFHELMLWRHQDEHDYDVALPEQTQHVRVFLIGDFLSKGWLDDVSCGAQGTGGWSADDGIYALASKYPDLDAEVFRVSLLAHEAQHYADKSHPGWKLADWELEYRAKLTELALARATSAGLLQQFARAQGDDPDVPHPYADKRVLEALRTQLRIASGAHLAAVPLARLQQAAREALRDDTRRRDAR